MSFYQSIKLLNDAKLNILSKHSLLESYKKILVAVSKIMKIPIIDELFLEPNVHDKYFTSLYYNIEDKIKSQIKKYNGKNNEILQKLIARMLLIVKFDLYFYQEINNFDYNYVLYRTEYFKIIYDGYGSYKMLYNYAKLWLSDIFNNLFDEHFFRIDDLFESLDRQVIVVFKNFVNYINCAYKIKYYIELSKYDTFNNYMTNTQNEYCDYYDCVEMDELNKNIFDMLSYHDLIKNEIKNCDHNVENGVFISISYFMKYYNQVCLLTNKKTRERLFDMNIETNLFIIGE